ncbi:MAG TPA: hypothetical protein VMQ61_16180 [Thermoanaerobaculia bacterium]|nr:hypothetical protein [Thermoanaerobaculia bacterium]
MDSETVEEIKRHFNVVAEGLRSETQGLRSEVGELRSEVGELRSETQGLRSEVGEIRRHFNVVAEGLRSEMRTLAEGLEATNGRIDGILTRMAEEFRDMRAVIRLSFGELDKRIRVLES